MEFRPNSAILDGKYFTVINVDADGVKIKAQCNSCIGKTIISGSTNALSNFTTHLKRVHADKVEEYKRYKDEWVKPESTRRGVKRNAPDTPSDCNTPPGPRLKQTKLFHKKAVDTVSQTQVDQLITNYVVKGLHVLSIVEQAEFMELVTGLRPSATVISKRTLGRRIDDSYKTKMQDVKDAIAKQETVCTTADIWSTPKRRYMGVTCHWIESENFVRKSAALACRRFKGAHTYDRIAEILCDIHDEFGLSTNKITATVTDNGSNFVKAFKEFGIQVSDLRVQYDDDDAVSNTDTPRDYDLSDNTETVEFLEMFDSLDKHPSGEIPCPANVIVLPTHLRCSSHTLNLAATRDASAALKTSVQFSRINHTAMGKCSALWNSCSRPKSAEKIYEICCSCLPTPCDTRWNSLYDSIKGLLEKRDVLPTLMSELKLPSFKDIELDFLDEYCQVLTPIAVALDRLQGEENCFYADLLPVLFKVNSQLTILQSVNFRHCFRPRRIGSTFQVR